MLWQAPSREMSSGRVCSGWGGLGEGVVWQAEGGQRGGGGSGRGQAGYGGLPQPL